MKNFLRPTKAKLIIFGLIFLFSIFLRGVITQSEIEYLRFAEITVSPHYLLYRLIIPLPPEPAGIIIGVTDLLLITLAFIAGLIYWYLLSCLIIFVYEKLKKKS